MDRSIDLSSKIPGWGADLDPANRPAVPKEKTPPHGTGAHWTEPEQQIPRVKIHKSIERPSLTPVFGTSCPPRGLSGLIRDFAYKFGEGRMLHWLPLLFADRVDVLEGIIEDFAKGKIPNPISEMGLRTELERRDLKKKAVIAGVGLVALASLAFIAKKSRTREA